MQRGLAFVFSLIGYLGTFLYGFFRAVPERLQLVLDSYLLSVILLFLVNFVFRIKASGHACSVTGPLALLVYFTGLIYLIPCLAAEALIFFASLRTGRHTLKQLIQGMAVALVSFGVAVTLHHFYGGL